MRTQKPGGNLIGKFKSIQSAVFTAIAVLALGAVFIVTAVSLNYTESSVFENSVMYTRTIVDQMNQNIDSYISYMDNMATIICGNRDVQEYLFEENEDVSESRSRLAEQFKLVLSGREDIRNIGILQDGGRSLINDGFKFVNHDLDINTQIWYHNAMSNYGKASLTSSHVQHVVRGERPWVITLSRGIRNFTGSGATEGVFFIDLNYSAISELCDQNNFGEKGYVFILDAEGNIVYHPQQQQLYNELQTENIDLVLNTDSDTIVTGSGDNDKIYTLSRSEKTGWTVVGCMNTRELLKTSRQAQFLYILTAVALVAIALWISSLVSRTVTYPIQRLRDSMERVQEGDFSAADIEISTENEIGSLTNSFNVMTHRIEDLMEQNRYEQEEKRKSELRALQSQINPHFLYNTLDSIIWMAEGKKNEEVVLMTASLARLLRQSISNEDEFVPIGKEIEYVRSYLTIQKMRYKDKLEFFIELEPQVRNVKMIKLALQPIVENAIYHGLKYKESKGLLTIKGYQKGEDAILEVADDGVGMDEETLKHIFDKHKVNYQSNGVGVYNVQKRLQLHYGNEYGIIYQSKKGEGTTAIIRIPIRWEG